MDITPNIKDFSKKIKSNKYKRFCLWKEISADLETPITAYLKLIKKNNSNFLLESVEGGSSRGRYSIIGANALVTENKVIPERSLVLGSPGKIIRQVTDEEIKSIKENAEHYVANYKKYKK